jgi:hypothetical protein
MCDRRHVLATCDESRWQLVQVHAQAILSNRAHAIQLAPAAFHLILYVWVVYLTPKIERITSLLSASPVGEARLPMPKGMADKD